MKHIFKKIFVWSIIILAFLTVLFFVTDVFIMPEVVNKKELAVPDLVGKQKEEAVEILKDLNLQVVLKGPRYNDKFPIDHVIYQKPEAGSIVKENRRIYLFISGGNPLIKMPSLENKSLRDAKITIENLGFVVSKVTQVESDIPANTVIEQYPKAETKLQRGAKVSLKVSSGPSIGMVRVPDLYGLSLQEARIVLSRNSLQVGKINYEESKNLLPNTVITQYPSKNNLIQTGESVDLFITKNEN